MTSSSGVACLEVFDENSQPSAEEISEYAQQLGIDPESESHLLPLAKDGLMQALPSPWKAFYDEKLQTHYYYNEETKNTQWDHPLDIVYREMVRKARDASMLDDTYVSVQELLTSEENTKQLERVETKVESDDDDLSTDNDNSDAKELPVSNIPPCPRRLAPLGRPPLAPISRPLDKKLNDLRISPLRKSVDSSFKPTASRIVDKVLERPKLSKQQSEIIDLKMHVLNSPEEEGFNLFGKGERLLKMGLPLTGKGSMFLKSKKSDLPSPDTEKSFPLDSITKSDPPKGILREKISDSFHRKVESLSLSKPKHTISFEEDRKSVRFQLENTTVEPTISPGSNSSSELNDGQSSIISATPTFPRPMPSPLVPFNLPITSSNAPMPAPNMPIVLSPIVTRPPLPPRPQNALDQILSPREKTASGTDKESLEHSEWPSPRRRVLRPPAADYINPELFQKSFHKITDLLLDQPDCGALDAAGKEPRPRSPMIPQINKISINLMESIESETSTDSPDREFANLDLNDMDNDKTDLLSDKNLDSKDSKESPKERNDSELQTQTSSTNKSPKNDSSVPQIIIPKLDSLQSLKTSDSDDSKRISNDSRNNSKSDSLDSNRNPEPKVFSPTSKISPNHNSTDLRSPKSDSKTPWSFKPSITKPASQIKASDSSTNLKSLVSPRLDGVVISQGKNLNRGSDNVVVMYQFEQQEEIGYPKTIKSSSEIARDMIERNKSDEKRRLELSLQKELEEIRVEWTVKERKMRAELLGELRASEGRFNDEKRKRLLDQEEKHRVELEEAIQECTKQHEQALKQAISEIEEQHKKNVESTEEKHKQELLKLQRDHAKELDEKRSELEREAEHLISSLRESSRSRADSERARLQLLVQQDLAAIRDQQRCKRDEINHDYRAELDTLRAAHACHVTEVRARLARERASTAASSNTTSTATADLQDKYRCLKHKYARLKHDVKMSIERRNKRREMSMTTGSETEKSNSHKGAQNLDRKEQNETSAIVEAAVEKARDNDNETSLSECHQGRQHRHTDNNNHQGDTVKQPSVVPSCRPSAGTTPGTGIGNGTTAGPGPGPGTGESARRQATVGFKEPLKQNKRHTRDRDGTTTDFQDSSDATTTADERPKESKNGHGRRRCFTRLKSASTSRLNYSPKRGEGWSSPLESLRQQLRKLDDLEDQFPDLACQPAYSLRYPFAGLDAVQSAHSPELEFVRHRALVEREELRSARAALRGQRDRLLSQLPASREMTELEVALHRARALLGEKEIRLQHIERALRNLPQLRSLQQQEGITTSASSSSSGSEQGTSSAGVRDGAGMRDSAGLRGGAGVRDSAGLRGGAGSQGSGAVVLSSLKALHADVRDIWRALDDRRTINVSPETSSCNTANQPTNSLSAQEAPRPNTDSVNERVRGLRAWLHTSS